MRVSRCRLCLAGIFVLLLAPALALQVAPAAFETELTVEQHDELIQALMASNIQPPRRLIVIDPPPPRPVTVRLIVREDEPGEIGPLAVAVVGDTIEDADVFRLDGDGDFSGPPQFFQFSWGSAVVVQGTPSSSLPLILRIVLDLARREPPTGVASPNAAARKDRGPAPSRVGARISPRVRRAHENNQSAKRLFANPKHVLTDFDAGDHEVLTLVGIANWNWEVLCPRNLRQVPGVQQP